MDLPAPHRLSGRDRELRALGGLVADLSANAGLVIAGEPGAGKSALLEAARARAHARDVRVLMARGLPRTRDTPLALAEEVLGLLRERRPAMAESLEDLVTDALAAAAAERPTVLLLDDGDWVDDLSWRALTHAARMLYDRPFALIVALPEGHPRVRGEGLPVLALGPLDDEAGRAVLAAANDDLPTFVAERILQAAAGNPMALIELARATPAQWRRQCVRPPVALPLSPALVREFSAGPEELPPATREVLLAAAANDSESLSEAVRAAAATLRIPAEDVLAACLAAFERRVVEGDAVTIRFRSEVARSAIYQGASLPRRHAMHVALARLLAGTPHRAAWHRAAASLLPDEALAEELAEAASVVRGRGRIRDALATMDRAARVSVDPVARVPRLIAAAAMSFELGRPDFVATFVEQAADTAGTPDHQRDVGLVRGLYDLWRPDTGGGARELLALAEAAFDAGDRTGAQTVLTRLVEKAHVTTAAQMPTAELREAARRMGGLAAVPALAGPLAVACPVECGADVLRHVRGLPPHADGDPRLARVLADAAAALGDDRLAVTFFDASIDRLRLDGRLGLLPFALLERARAYLAVAGLDLAAADVAEGRRLAVETGQPVLVGRFLALEALIAGVLGDLAQATALADEAEQAALARPALLADVFLARGRAHLTAGEPDQAYRWLLRLWEDDLSQLATSRRWATIGDLAEAAAAVGCADDVRPLVERLTIAAATVPSPVLAMGVAHARAALTGDEHCEDDLLRMREEGLRLGPFAAARAHLAYGAWLRRRRQISQARLELRAAVAGFNAAGTTAWADRARAELRAAGAPVGLDPERAVAELTAQERQIAELAAAGLSNREIGARMFLSPRTISTHLYRTFPKLGVTSRAQLRSALDGLAPDAGAASGTP